MTETGRRKVIENGRIAGLPNMDGLFMGTRITLRTEPEAHSQADGPYT